MEPAAAAAASRQSSSRGQQSLSESGTVGTAGGSSRGPLHQQAPANNTGSTLSSSLSSLRLSSAGGRGGAIGSSSSFVKKFPAKSQQQQQQQLLLRIHGEASQSQAAASMPSEPWLEHKWDARSDAYKQLRHLYSEYFDHVQRDSREDIALIDLVMCRLDCFVGALDSLLDRRLLLLLVNSFANTAERHLTRKEFVSLMFFLSFAAKEQLEEAVFDIVSAGGSRVSVGQLVRMHVHHTQHQLSADFVNLVSECDRSGCGQLDIYDFRCGGAACGCSACWETKLGLFIERLQEMEQAESNSQLPVDSELYKLEEALLEAQELQSWSWSIDKPKERCSLQLRNLGECREALALNPDMADTISKLAWDHPEVLSAKFIEMAIKQCSSSSSSSSSSSIATSTSMHVMQLSNKLDDDAISLATDGDDEAEVSEAAPAHLTVETPEETETASTEDTGQDFSM